MRWSSEAEQAVKRVPFFIRPKVKKAVERLAASKGAGTVTLSHVQECKQRYLGGQHDGVQGLQVETCFGPSGCSNLAVSFPGFADRVERLLEEKGISRFIREGVSGPLKPHHEFRVSISDCPNGCSRPQIADIGLLGAAMPDTAEASACNGCGSCVEVCREAAVELRHPGPCPLVLSDRCLGCGQCAVICPTGAIAQGAEGYRVLVGGKLGRHPRLGTELGLFTPEQALEIVSRAAELYMDRARPGQRLGALVDEIGLGRVKAALLE